MNINQLKMRKVSVEICLLNLKSFVVFFKVLTCLLISRSVVRKHITASDEFAVVQAVVEIMNEYVYGKNGPRKHGWPEGF